MSSFHDSAGNIEDQVTDTSTDGNVVPPASEREATKEQRTEIERSHRVEAEKGRARLDGESEHETEHENEDEHQSETSNEAIVVQNIRSRQPTTCPQAPKTSKASKASASPARRRRSGIIHNDRDTSDKRQKSTGSSDVEDFKRTSNLQHVLRLFLLGKPVCNEKNTAVCAAHLKQGLIRLDGSLDVPASG